jgi:hypothetical protein
MDVLNGYDMKKAIIYKILLSIICLILTITGLDSQVVTSEKAIFHINNLVSQNESSPDIKIIEPSQLKLDETFVVERQSVTIAMKLLNPEKGVKIYLNYVEISPTSTGDVFLRTLDLNTGSNLINISIQKDDKLVKDYAYTMVYVPPVKNISPYSLNLGKYYALIIANCSYISPELPTLVKPIIDAKALKGILSSKYTFEAENIYTLFDMRRDNLIMTLDEIQKKLTPEDNLLIYYAGHGKMDEESGNGYWLLSDASMSTRVNWFSNSALTDYIRAIKAKHIFLIADACYAGSIFVARGVFENAPSAIEDIYRSRSRTALTSGGRTEVNDESKFTEFLLEFLKNNADQYLTSSQLFHLIERPVLNSSATAPRFGVIQNVNDMQGDFVFILKEK